MLNHQQEKDKVYQNADCFYFKAAVKRHSIKEAYYRTRISEATLYSWKSHYGGMEAMEVKRPKDLEDKNAGLKSVCRAEPGLQYLMDLILK